MGEAMKDSELIAISIIFSVFLFPDNQLLSGIPILLLTISLLGSENKKRIGIISVGMILLSLGLESNSIAWTGYWLGLSSLILTVFENARQFKRK